MLKQTLVQQGIQRTIDPIQVQLDCVRLMMLREPAPW